MSRPHARLVLPVLRSVSSTKSVWYSSSTPCREGCRILRNAFDSICLMRSRVTCGMSGVWSIGCFRFGGIQIPEYLTWQCCTASFMLPVIAGCCEWTHMPEETITKRLSLGCIQKLLDRLSVCQIRTLKRLPISSSVFSMPSSRPYRMRSTPHSRGDSVCNTLSMSASSMRFTASSSGVMASASRTSDHHDLLH